MNLWKSLVSKMVCLRRTLLDNELNPIFLSWIKNEIKKETDGTRDVTYKISGYVCSIFKLLIQVRLLRVLLYRFSTQFYTSDMTLFVQSQKIYHFLVHVRVDCISSHKVICFVFFD